MQPGARTYRRGSHYILRAGSSLALLLCTRIGRFAACDDSETILAFLAPDTRCAVRTTQLAVQQTGVLSRAAGIAIAALSTQSSHITCKSLRGIAC